MSDRLYCPQCGYRDVADLCPEGGDASDCEHLRRKLKQERPNEQR